MSESPHYLLTVYGTLPEPSHQFSEGIELLTLPVMNPLAKQTQGAFGRNNDNWACAGMALAGKLASPITVNISMNINPRLGNSPPPAKPGGHGEKLCFSHPSKWSMCQSGAGIAAMASVARPAGRSSTQSHPWMILRRS